jgi:hypothetical protein
MNGFLGGGLKAKATRLHTDIDGDEDQDEDEDEEDITGEGETGGDLGPPPFDLIYILDAIFHFPPSLPYFLNTALHYLTPETGIIAYTDILPPANLSPMLSYLILPWLLSVPFRNLVQRPDSLEGYKGILENIGYEGVVVEDWSEGVWPGFAANLKRRGGVWSALAWRVERAKRAGWKFVGVRARRPGTKNEVDA